MIKKGNKVKILAGKDKNKEGEVIEIERSILAEEPDVDFSHIGESTEKKYSLELMESFILLDNQK